MPRATKAAKVGWRLGALLALAAAATGVSSVEAKSVRQFDEWWIDCVEVADGSAGPAGRCAARTRWRDSVTLLVLYRDGAPLVLVQTASSSPFDRGDAVSIQTGSSRQHLISPQRPQTAIFAAPEGDQIVTEWKNVETGGETSFLNRMISEGGEIVVQVRQTRGSGRLARFSPKGFALAMAALTELESGTALPPAEPAEAPAGPGMVDDILKRVQDLFR